MGCPAGVIAVVGQCKESKLYYIADVTEVVAPYSRPGGTGRSIGGTVWVGCCPRDCTRHAKTYRGVTGCEERGQRKKAFHSHGVGVGVCGPWEGQLASGWRENSNRVGVREEPFGSGHVGRAITPRALGAACSWEVSLRTGGGRGATRGSCRDWANAGRKTEVASKSKTTAVCVEAVAAVVESPIKYEQRPDGARIL